MGRKKLYTDEEYAERRLDSTRRYRASEKGRAASREISRRKRAAMSPDERAAFNAARRENRKPLTDEQKAAALVRHAAWRQANPEKVRANARTQQKRWRAAHPELAAEKDAANFARRRGLKSAGRFTAKQWAETLEVFGHCCAYCGARAALTQDHMTPISRGGEHAPENVVPACLPCNQKKSARGPLSMVNQPYGKAA